MKAITPAMKPELKKPASRFWAKFRQQKYLYMMAVPFVLWAFVFSYLPLWGWMMAFQKYKPGKSFLSRNGSACSISGSSSRMSNSSMPCATLWR